MLRCLVRLRPPALLIAGTPSGIRWVVASAWVAGYGDIRSSSSVAALNCTMQCSLYLQIASTRRCAFALQWFCFPQNPGHFYFFALFIFAYDAARHCRSGLDDNVKV